MADITQVALPNGSTYNIKDANAFVAANMFSFTVSLPVASWSSYSQTVTATGVTATATVVVSPAPSSFEEYGDKGVYCSGQAANSLTFTCSTVPANALTVNVLVIKL